MSKIGIVHGVTLPVADASRFSPGDRIEIRGSSADGRWQRFRERWFPRWWLRWFPVRRVSDGVYAVTAVRP